MFGEKYSVGYDTHSNIHITWLFENVVSKILALKNGVTFSFEYLLSYKLKDVIPPSASAKDNNWSNFGLYLIKNLGVENSL